MAYESEALVNYCPALGTVLANEEVENGRAKEGGHPVEKRPLRQWILKITAYAERLIEDLDLVDWPESLKKLQINWIGKSEGAQIDFQVKDHPDKITVFTTRHDTLFGTTFMVLAPEHPLVMAITTPDHRNEVAAYQKKVESENEIDRTDMTKTKTGVFTGAYCINPANQQPIPIWIADYVLMGYGTGAVMGVPTNDMRDFEFAQKYKLPILSVIDPDFASFPEAERQEIVQGKKCWEGEGTYINSANFEVSLHGLTMEQAKQQMVEWLESKRVGSRARDLQAQGLAIFTSTLLGRAFSNHPLCRWNKESA